MSAGIRRILIKITVITRSTSNFYLEYAVILTDGKARRSHLSNHRVLQIYSYEYHSQSLRISKPPCKWNFAFAGRNFPLQFAIQRLQHSTANTAQHLCVGSRDLWTLESVQYWKVRALQCFQWKLVWCTCTYSTSLNTSFAVLLNLRVPSKFFKTFFKKSFKNLKSCLLRYVCDRGEITRNLS